VHSLITGPSLAADAFGSVAPTLAQETCRRGEAWSWDGVGFAWLHPGVDRYERDNDSSCVLLLRAGGHSVLVTGDIEAVAEQELIAGGFVPPVDVVIVPHHGSRTSSTAGFVAATGPQWVVYAVGHRNRWNFPVPRVVVRWEQSGARGLHTSRSGAITFELLPGQALESPTEWRRERPGPWRDP
jgi:competence protein ComEC